jgi:hypothetical protein
MADHIIAQFCGQFPSIADRVTETISPDSFYDLDEKLSEHYLDDTLTLLTAYFEAIVNYHSFCNEHTDKKLSNKLSKEQYRLKKVLRYASTDLEKFAEADFGKFDIV